MEKIVPAFQKHWEEVGFQEPTMIQKEAFTYLEEGKDMVGISPTGTGKTLAYALPALQKVAPSDGVQLVILEPSQELAVQVGEVVKEWANEIQLTTLTLIGNANIKRQIEKLKAKPEVIVGTPGRILELAEQRKLKLHQVRIAILDEADQLLSQDQLHTVREVVKKMPSERQMGFFSATSNEVVAHLQRWFNADPEWVDVTETDDSKGELSHAYIEMPVRKRNQVLKQLTNMDGFRALVFFNDVGSLMTTLEKLQYDGVSAEVLHSEENKTARKKNLQAFRSGKLSLLLTTDLAARGLDIQDLDYVVQYDLPISKESYVHRSGRTGRMKRKGTVLTLVNERDLRNFKQLISPLNIDLQKRQVYQGELVSEKPAVEKEMKTKTVSKPKQKETIRVKPVEQSEKKKKKHRRKNQKNKGARKKKS